MKFSYLMSNHRRNTPVSFAQQIEQAKREFEPRIFSRGSIAYLGFEDSTSKILRALQYMPISALCKTPLEGANSDFMFCFYQILQQLTLLTECEPTHPKAVLAVHRKVIDTLYNHLYFLHSQDWLWIQAKTRGRSNARSRLSTMVSGSQCNKSLALALAIRSHHRQPKGRTTALTLISQHPSCNNNNATRMLLL